MLIDTAEIKPSQSFLKEKSIQYIFNCLETGRTAELPPTPVVRESEDGNYIAIDGHNLIAVRHYRGEKIEVHVASSKDDILSGESEAIKERNQILRDNYESVPDNQFRAASLGITSFAKLTSKYETTFAIYTKPHTTE